MQTLAVSLTFLVQSLFLLSTLNLIIMSCMQSMQIVTLVQQPNHFQVAQICVPHQIKQHQDYIYQHLRKTHGAVMMNTTEMILNYVKCATGCC